MCLVESTKVFKSIKALDFLQLQKLGILLVGVSIISIKQHCLFIVKSNLHPKLDLQCIPPLLSLGIIEEAIHLLSVINISAELLSSRLVDEFIIMCIISKLYWSIVHHHLHGFQSYTTIFPIDQYFMDLVEFLDDTVIFDVLE